MPATSSPQHGLDELFDAVVISEEVGAQKPDPSMFRRALAELGLTPHDAGRAVMVGNRLERDVKGARELGMVGVWIDWSPRYAKRPTSPPPSPTTSSRTRSSSCRCSSASSATQAEPRAPDHANPWRP